MSVDKLCYFSREMAAAAAARGKAMGALRTSFLRGGGNKAGFCGEMSLAEVLKQSGLHVCTNDTYDYDIKVKPRAAAVPVSKLEVKTKNVTTVPRSHYMNSVSASNVRQKADYYVFVRVKFNAAKDGGTLYFCGAKPCAEFRAEATFVKTGDRDPSNGFVCANDCWSLPISKCLSWAAFARLLAGDAKNV
jgi:hypothetical protein